jgi:hypothetical protein
MARSAVRKLPPENIMSVILRNCPHCPAESSSFTLIWTARIPNKPPYYHNCAAICGACSKPICFQVKKGDHGTTKPTDHVGNIEHGYHVVGIWPSRNQHVAPLHTPAAVKTRFLEGEDAFGRGRWNSAVAMYRSALDIATKAMEGVPPNSSFFRRLEWLHENHRITPDIKSWADHVRVEGNAALHDPEEFVEEDAKSLRFFTEMFLRYVFELPGEVRRFRGNSS